MWWYWKKQTSPCVTKLTGGKVNLTFESQTCFQWVLSSAMLLLFSLLTFVIFMERIWCLWCAWNCNLRFAFLCFADDVVLSASSVRELQHVLWQFAVEYEAAGMESGPPSLRTWFSAKKWWIAVSRFGLNRCPKQRILCISRFCS